MKKVFAIASILFAGAVSSGEVFEGLDVDKSDSIDMDEAAVMPVLIEQWDELDVDNNNQLSLEEFSNIEVGAPKAEMGEPEVSQPEKK